MANQVITFGCRLNAYESESIKKALHQSKKDNLIVFNSCAVTSESERQLRQAIRKTAKEHPTSEIIITGCAAQINPHKYAKMEEVSLVLGNEEKSNYKYYTSDKNEINKKRISKNNTSQLPHKDKLFSDVKKAEKNIFFNSQEEEKVIVNDIMSVKKTNPHLISSLDNKNRAFVQIQNGCNHRCTFCIIPYGRGNSRSVPFGQIVKQVQKLVANGYKEIVLTGVDITDYGKDLISGLTFASMIKRLLKLVPELPRLRISSIDVAEVDNDNDFFDLIANEPRFMPHIHISLQAGDDMVLKRMARRHNRKQIIDFCHKAKKLRPEITFGSDIIAGFPTESDAMFNNTLNLISETGMIFNHIFPYSIREGTPAAKMPQITTKIKKERAKKLREATEIELYKFLDNLVGKKQKIILESNDLGRCENFITTKILNNTNMDQGEIYEVLIRSRHGNHLVAELTGNN